MNNYEKPLVLSNEELAEGVYAASGEILSGTCWTVNPVLSQEWNGTSKVYEVYAKHSDTVKHWSKGSIFTITFSDVLTSVRPENVTDYVVSWSGNTVTVERNLGADSYLSGDNYTCKIFVNGTSEDATRALQVLSSTISCKVTANVQGEGGDGSSHI